MRANEYEYESKKINSTIVWENNKAILFPGKQKLYKHKDLCSEYGEVMI